MWTSLNGAWLRFSARTIDDIWKTAPEAFYVAVARDLDTFSGVAQTTMYRDEGWRFLQLGRFTERAQLMIALLLAQLALVREGPEGAVGGDWPGLLRICQALDAYARCHGAEISADRVLDLLVTDVLLPRSLSRALEMASRRPGTRPPSARDRRPRRDRRPTISPRPRAGAGRADRAWTSAPTACTACSRSAARCTTSCSPRTSDTASTGRRRVDAMRPHRIGGEP